VLPCLLKLKQAFEVLVSFDLMGKHVRKAAGEIKLPRLRLVSPHIESHHHHSPLTTPREGQAAIKPTASVTSV
jgi:hypothetical protein